jgi:hypothetical protein
MKRPVYTFTVIAFQQEFCSMDLVSIKSSHNWPPHTPAFSFREFVSAVLKLSVNLVCES